MGFEFGCRDFENLEVTMGVAKYIKNEKDEVLDVVLQSGIHVRPSNTQKD